MTVDRPLPPLPEMAPGIYTHYKGQRYLVYGLARHSETLEPLVVYRPMYGEGALWVRPWAMFTQQIEVDGRPCARFAWTEPAPKGSELACEVQRSTQGHAQDIEQPGV